MAAFILSIYSFLGDCCNNFAAYLFTFIYFSISKNALALSFCVAFWKQSCLVKWAFNWFYLFYSYSAVGLLHCSKWHLSSLAMDEKDLFWFRSEFACLFHSRDQVTYVCGWWRRLAKKANYGPDQTAQCESAPSDHMYDDMWEKIIL